MAYATDNFRDASLFFVIPTDNDAHQNEFYITYRGEGYKPQDMDSKGELTSGESIQKRQQDKTVYSISRYLNAPTQLGRHCRGPLQLKLNVKACDVRFKLICRLIKGSKPVSTAPWLSHRDTFFIMCARRGFYKNAFLAVQRHTNDDRWITCCVKSTEGEDYVDTFMLFRLLPRTYTPTSWAQEESKGSDKSGGTGDAIQPSSRGAAKTTLDEAEQIQPKRSGVAKPTLDEAEQIQPKRSGVAKPTLDEAEQAQPETASSTSGPIYTYEFQIT